MPSPTRQIVFVAVLSVSLCTLARSARSESETLRRLTHTPPESLSLNPSISGDGRRVAFESNADLDGAHGPSAFRLYTAGADSPSTFETLAASRAPAPALSQDGARLAFASKDDPLGRNRDGNSEIFYLDSEGLTQLTETLPADPSQRARQGSFQPSISDDGDLIAFSSNLDLCGANTERNTEIFLFDRRTKRLEQLTDAEGASSASGAKISGDGSRVAFIRADAPVGAQSSDLLVYERATGTAFVADAGVPGLAFTHGRAISDDGQRVVYSANTAANTTQVFLYDGRNKRVRQITRLGARAADVPLHPTISGDGNRIAFATRRSVTGGNADASVELYLYDIAPITIKWQKLPLFANNGCPLSDS